MSEKTKPVTFRLPLKEYALLTELVTKAGSTRAEYLCELIMTRLSANPEDRLADRLERLEDLITQLHEAARSLIHNQRVSTQVLLCDAGRAEADEAEQFVRENLD